MPMQELTIKRREGTGKQLAKRLRREGVVPGIVYGGAKTEPVTVDPKAVLRMLVGHGRTTQLLTIKFDGDSGSRMAIIRAMQFDPVTEKLLHVDLQEVSPDKPITVRVAVHPTGEAVGVRDTQGILNLVLHEVDVSCLPTAIPEQIDADVSNLAIGDVLTIAQLQVPAGVRVLNDPNQAVVTVAPPAAEEVAAVAAVPTEATAAEPEVLTERKPKEEAGEADKAGGEKKK